MSKHKRRLIPIVDRSFQFKYTGLIVVVAGIVSLVLGYFLLDAYTEMNSMIDISDAIGAELNAADAQRVFRLVVGMLLLEVIALGVLGLLVTHRVAGPVFVLHRYFSELAEGRYPTVRGLRKGDEFKDTFTLFVAAIDTLKTRDDKEAKVLQDLIDRGGLDDDQKAAVQALLDDKQARVQA